MFIPSVLGAKKVVASTAIAVAPTSSACLAFKKY